VSLYQNIKINEENCLKGKIIDIGLEKTWVKKMSIITALIQDETASIQAIWFNQPYLMNILKKGDEVLLAGKVIIKNGRIILSSPVYEKVSSQETTHLGRVFLFIKKVKGSLHDILDMF